MITRCRCRDCGADFVVRHRADEGGWEVAQRIEVKHRQWSQSCALIRGISRVRVRIVKPKPRRAEKPR